MACKLGGTIMKVRRRPRVLLRTKVGEDHTTEDKQQLQKNTRAHDMGGPASRLRYWLFFSIIEPQSMKTYPKN